MTSRLLSAFLMPTEIIPTISIFCFITPTHFALAPPLYRLITFFENIRKLKLIENLNAKKFQVELCIVSFYLFICYLFGLLICHSWVRI